MTYVYTTHAEDAEDENTELTSSADIAEDQEVMDTDEPTDDMEAGEEEQEENTAETEEAPAVDNETSEPAQEEEEAENDEEAPSEESGQPRAKRIRLAAPTAPILSPPAVRTPPPSPPRDDTDVRFTMFLFA